MDDVVINHYTLCIYSCHYTNLHYEMCIISESSYCLSAVVTMMVAEQTASIKMYSTIQISITNIVQMTLFQFSIPHVSKWAEMFLLIFIHTYIINSKVALSVCLSVFYAIRAKPLHYGQLRSVSDQKSITFLFVKINN